ncbi:MAG TPA: PVC-type heme-binding CxxCH protein [Opitutaceae bacterium]|nr:PVC-type heme-binding CxxCH protein [Opitutaceae bacterium]
MKRRTLTLFAVGGAAAALVVGCARKQHAEKSEKSAVTTLTTPADLAIDRVLQEPTIAQPVFLNFDERGRMWVVQYRQYPYPAGLKVESHDEFWRVVYDRKKPPPPYDTLDKSAFRGNDRITIHEDVAGDGSFSKTITFLDGLNITTAVCRGRGGVWVLSPPQLLFYPDANNDDVPDGPPSVLLDGFGIEDTHAVANSLRWGPDGWLYGAQGSTVTADIVRPGIDRAPIAHIAGQCIWRYQPESHRFEVYAEGGGNTFGCEIDSKGRVFSGHNGGNTRGFHYVQGGYFLKGFEKHGALSNPYAFGYFPPMRHPAVARFSHNFIIYEGGALPERYRGQLVAIDPLNGEVPLTEITPRGSTFTTRDIDAVVRSSDQHFRPVDIKHGPDGAIYVADWYDLKITHTDNTGGGIENADGRIYRVRAANAHTGVAPFDLTKKSSSELVELLRNENRWIREQALRLLGDRHDATLVTPLRDALPAATGQFALEELWALNLSGGFDEPTARSLLKHADPYVRLWTVRLLGDTGGVTADTAQALAALAASEPNVEVRSQLAASAKRFSAAVALPIVRGLLVHDADADDPYLPLQIWWAVESKCGSDADAVVQLFRDGTTDAASLWHRPLVARHLTERLMRRFAAAGGRENLLICAELLDAAPDADTRKELMAGFEKAFEGRVLPALPDELVAAMIKAGGGSLALRIREKDPAAIDEALRTMADPKTPSIDRLRLISVFGQVPAAPASAVLVRLLHDNDPAVRDAALGAAAAYDDANLTAAILAGYAQFSAKEKVTAQSVLSSRLPSATALLDAVEAGSIPRETIQPDTREKMRLLASGKLAPRLDHLFGGKIAAQPEQVRAEVARVLGVVSTPGGDPYRGRTQFEQTCAACHRLYGKGGEIGPDLTSFKRDDLPSIVLNIVNPSAEIREGYESFIVTTKDGSVYSGFLASQDPQRVVLRDMAGVSITLERAKIATMNGIGRSLMPEGLLSGKSDAELRDLFSYLRTTQPLVYNPRVSGPKEK